MGQQSERPAPSGRARPDGQLLEALGLDDRATSDDVERVHAELIEFLSTAPRSLRGWASAQASQADEALVALTDPSAADRPAALAGPAPRLTVRPGGTATPPARQAASRPSSARANRVAAPVAAPDTSIRIPRGVLKAAAALAFVGIVGGVGFIVYQSGLPPITAAQPTPTPRATASLDEAAVAALMTKIQADPSDVETLIDLGDLYFDAGKFSVSADWLSKAVAIEADNVRALLALGAARFNMGDADTAKAHWLRVVELDAENVEAHYDLGFLYLNAEPMDSEGVRREWNLVVQLAPDTDLAAIVKAHLEALPTPGPSGAGSPVPTAAPSGGASAQPSPATSPATSPAASAAPSPAASTQP